MINPEILLLKCIVIYFSITINYYFLYIKILFLIGIHINIILYIIFIIIV